MDVGLIFGMIVAIFIIGLLIVYGYQQITNLQDMQEQANLLKAVDGITAAVDRVYSLGGESSEKFRLSFPGGVSKVCFMPSYRGELASMKEARLRVDLAKVIDAPNERKYEIARLLAEMRFGYQQGSSAKVDKNYTLLVSFNSGSVPKWYLVPHLGPSRKTVAGEEILCTSPRGEIRLSREFDSAGAWVDADMA